MKDKIAGTKKEGKGNPFPPVRSLGLESYTAHPCCQQLFFQTKKILKITIISLGIFGYLAACANMQSAQELEKQQKSPCACVRSEVIPSA